MFYSYSSFTSVGYSYYCLQQQFSPFADYCSFCSSVTVGWFTQCIFKLSQPWIRDILSLLAYFIPFSGTLYCILAIEMLFQNLALHAQISNFQCPLASQQLTIQLFHSAEFISDNYTLQCTYCSAC